LEHKLRTIMIESKHDVSRKAESIYVMHLKQKRRAQTQLIRLEVLVYLYTNKRAHARVVSFSNLLSRVHKNYQFSSRDSKQ